MQAVCCAWPHSEVRRPGNILTRQNGAVITRSNAQHKLEPHRTVKSASVPCDSRHGEPSREAYLGLLDVSWAVRSMSIPPPVSAPVALSIVLGSLPLPSLKSLSEARMFAKIPIKP